MLASSVCFIPKHQPIFLHQLSRLRWYKAINSVLWPSGTSSPSFWHWNWFCPTWHFITWEECARRPKQHLLQQQWNDLIQSHCSSNSPFPTSWWGKSLLCLMSHKVYWKAVKRQMFYIFTSYAKTCYILYLHSIRSQILMNIECRKWGKDLPSSICFPCSGFL